MFRQVLQPFSVPDRLEGKGNENKSKVAVFQTESGIKSNGAEQSEESSLWALPSHSPTINQLLILSSGNFYSISEFVNSLPPSKVLYNFPIKPSFPGWEWMFNTLQLSALVGVTPDKDSPDSPRHQITPCLTLSLGLFSFSDMRCQIKMNADEKCLVNLFTWCVREPTLTL